LNAFLAPDRLNLRDVRAVLDTLRSVER
jgi:hypothetical protein